MRALCGEGFVTQAGITILGGSPVKLYVSSNNKYRSACMKRRITRTRAPQRAFLVQCNAESRSQRTDEDEEVLDEAAMRAAEIHEVLNGLQDFKNRIVDDATKLAKKVRAPKKQLEAALAQHPDIIKIDGHIAQLQEELKQLGDR